jgi:hypothetical protein
MDDASGFSRESRRALERRARFARKIGMNGQSVGKVDSGSALIAAIFASVDDR